MGSRSVHNYEEKKEGLSQTTQWDQDNPAKAKEENMTRRRKKRARGGRRGVGIIRETLIEGEGGNTKKIESSLTKARG